MKLLSNITAAVLLGALLLSGCSSAAAGEDTLTVTIPKIGKADCSILRQGKETLVIDCGEAENSDTVLSTLKSAGITEVNALVITHFDKDHVGGAAQLLRSIPVAQVIEPDYTPENPEAEAYVSYRQALSDTGVPVTAVRDTLGLSLGTAQITVTGTGGRDYTKNIDNNHSLLLSVTHGGNRLLFTGDVEKQRIEDLLDAGVDACDFVKIPHHGGYSSALPKYLSALRPQYAVITCSNKNPADERTLEALDTLGIQTFETVNGTVRVTSSSQGIRVTQ